MHRRQELSEQQSNQQLAEANERLRMELRALKARQRELDQQFAEKTEELKGVLHRYETALRGSNVTVFTQDRELRYTSITNPLFGLTVEQIIGRTDDDVLPAESRAPIAAIKRETLATGRPQDGEVSIYAGGRARWYDLHIEPHHDVTGAIDGLTCAAVDITERNEGEAHLRLLMRELTHRSKNLLAIIQGLARQTARHVNSVDGFLDQFGARLQALATSHDLLVQQSWHGVSLAELTRVYLGQDRNPYHAQISAAGPDVFLKPEAAQSLGLALHELTTNAAAYGALSNPAGRVAVRWRRLAPEDRSGVELLWQETGGPNVTAPDQRGFGSLMIERNLARAIDAQVELDFAPDGVRCRIMIPVGHLAVGR
jgi:PAS domain S-box-containing protein